jgi:hypothetical protein
MGILTQEEIQYVSPQEAHELFLINSDQIEAEYPEEHQGIIGIYEDEVN